jgi:hypothetical protein
MTMVANVQSGCFHGLMVHVLSLKMGVTEKIG